MNSLINDKGQLVTTIGAPGSIARLKCAWPKLLEDLEHLFLSDAMEDEAYDLMRERGVPNIDQRQLISISSFRLGARW